MLHITRRTDGIEGLIAFAIASASRADGIILTDKFAVRQPVDASGSPQEPSCHEFCAWSELVDSRGQVTGQVEPASYPAIGILGPELDGVGRKSVLGKDVAVRQEIEKISFRQRVDGLFVAVNKESLAIVHGLHSPLLERVDVRGEFYLDLLKQVSKFLYPGSRRAGRSQSGLTRAGPGTATVERRQVPGSGSSCTRRLGGAVFPGPGRKNSPA